MGMFGYKIVTVLVYKDSTKNLLCQIELFVILDGKKYLNGSHLGWE